MASSASSSQERYVRLLERDLETLRAELRVAREKAEKPELLRELREAQEQQRADQRRLTELERQLELAHEAERTYQAAQEASEAMRDEFRQQQMALASLERDLAHASDGMRTAEHREASLQEQLQRAREESQRVEQRALEQQQQATQQLRQAQHEREAAALEHSRAVSQAQLEHGSIRNELRMREQELRAKEQTIESLNARLKKETDRAAEAQVTHERLVADLKASKAEMEGSLRTALQESQNRASQLSMKEELIALLEDENKHKQARLDEQDKAFTSLRTELLQAQERNTDLTGECTTLEHRISELESQLQTGETLRKEAEAREGKVRDTYLELADTLGATEAQRQSNTVITRAKQVVAELDRVSAELRELQREHEVVSHEGSSRSLRAEQLQRDLERAGAEHKRLEGEAGSLRQDLLSRTRELKDMTLAHEQLHRELRNAEERVARFDDVIREKDRYAEVGRGGVSETGGG
jgi:chromosome segregation ATPase